MTAAATPAIDTSSSVVISVTGDGPDGGKTPGKLSVPKLAISWENVGFQVKIKDPATGEVENKTILKSVSGEAVPGELMVLMGPSGAGKSTLLDCISARNRSCTGTILVNGKSWSKRVAKHTGYVVQDDLFYANLTVLEHLTFQAELRMGKSCPKAVRGLRVRSIISEMGLTKVTNTPIGHARQGPVGRPAEAPVLCDRAAHEPVVAVRRRAHVGTGQLHGRDGHSCHEEPRP